MKIVSLLLLAIASISLAGTLETVKQSKVDIREAVFRYQFAHLTPEQQKVQAKFYILICGFKEDDAVPDKQFLKRFEGNIPPVNNGYRTVGAAEGYFLRETGDRGLLFMAGRVEWPKEDAATVLGYCATTTTSHEWYVYHLTMKDGKWTVINVELKKD